MRKPRALRPGDRIAVVAPASAFARHEFEAGIAELRALGFDPTYEESVFERRAYLAGPADVRASAWLRAWTDPSIAALIAVRGGFGSVQLLPALAELDFDSLPPKAFIAYSDNTSILSWLTTRKGIVTIHGPMLEGRLAHGDAGYDRDTFLRCVCRPALSRATWRGWRGCRAWPTPSSIIVSPVRRCRMTRVWRRSRCLAASRRR